MLKSLIKKSIKLLRFRDLFVTAVSITPTNTLYNYTENIILNYIFIHLNLLLDCSNNSEFRESATSSTYLFP